MNNLIDNLSRPLTNENESLENNYQKTFPKIARDFITRDELKWILNSIFNSINNVNPEIGNALFENYSNIENIEIAINKSKEYDENQHRPDSFKNIYKDIK